MHRVNLVAQTMGQSSRLTVTNYEMAKGLELNLTIIESLICVRDAITNAIKELEAPNPKSGILGKVLIEIL